MPVRRAVRRTPPRRLLLASLLALACRSDGDDAAAGADLEPRRQPHPEQRTPRARRRPLAPTLRAACRPAAPRPTRSRPRPARDLLDWQPVPGLGRRHRHPQRRRGRSRSTRPATPGAARGAGRRGTVRGRPRQRISDALLDGTHAVVVLQDRQEQPPERGHGRRPALGQARSRSTAPPTPPTTIGGTWALGDGHLCTRPSRPAAPTASPRSTSRPGSRRSAGAPRRGTASTAPRSPPPATSLMTFDDAPPVLPHRRARSTARDVDAVPGRPRLHGLGRGCSLDDGAVWSVIPNEHRIEAAHFYARTGDGYYDLGPGTSGTPDLVRRRGVLRPRPAARRRPGAR